MNNVRELVTWATTQLAAAQCMSPENDARLLLSYVLKCDRNELDSKIKISDSQQTEFKVLVDQRANRIPLQYLTGQAFFRFLELHVGPGVFIPRPETELLVQAGLDHLTLQAGPTLAVDLCAGSGAIALSLALENANTTVHAVEFSPEAFNWLEKNVQSYSEQLARVNSSVITYNEDATSRKLLSELNKSVDLVLSNPPYIPNEMIPREPEVREHDPALALYGGADGLEIARKVSVVAADLLKPNGLFGMEHADVQGASAAALLINQQVDGNEIWSKVVDHNDYNQLPRFVTANRTSIDSSPL